MSVVKRTVILNPIEAAPLSFRGGRQVDTTLEVTYYGQDGQPLHNDVDGQLQLTSRTAKTMTAYSVPAIDIANGRARATIPAGDLTDINGYRAVLYGSVSGQAAMIARGLVFADDYAAPVSAPIDVIDSVPLTFDRALATSTGLTVKLWDDTGKTDPYDMTSSVVTAAVYDNVSRASKLTDFSVTTVDSNSVKISLTPAQVAGLPDACWWGLRIGGAAGVTTLCEGPVTVAGTAPPVFVNLTANWNYVKPATGTPTTGQIVHQNNVQDQLLIHGTDSDGTDRTSTLVLLKLNDQVVCGAQTWSVVQVVNQSSYFTVYINPYTQLGTTGVQSFTLQRP